MIFFHVVGRQAKCKKNAVMGSQKRSAMQEWSSLKNILWLEVHTRIWFFLKLNLKSGETAINALIVLSQHLIIAQNNLRNTPSLYLIFRSLWILLKDIILDLLHQLMIILRVLEQAISNMNDER